MSRSNPIPATIFVFDTGTTGKDPTSDAIHTLAAVKYDPLVSAPHIALQVTPWNSTSTHRSASPAPPPFYHAWTLFHAFIDDNTPAASTPLLVAHNLSFDLAFLLAELDRAALPRPPWRFACSLRLASAVLAPVPGQRTSYSQAALAERFGVSVRREHHAGDDVRVLREVLSGIEQEGNDVQRLCEEGARNAHEFESGTVCKDAAVVGDGKWVVTATGKCFHASKECVGLLEARTTHSMKRVPEGLRPCHFCFGGGGAVVRQEVAPTGDGGRACEERTVNAHELESGTVCEDAVVVGDGKWVVTDTGKCFHASKECVGLRGARTTHSVERVPEGLRPCHFCFKGGGAAVGQEVAPTGNEGRAEQFYATAAEEAGDMDSQRHGGDAQLRAHASGTTTCSDPARRCFPAEATVEEIEKLVSAEEKEMLRPSSPVPQAKAARVEQRTPPLQRASGSWQPAAEVGSPVTPTRTPVTEQEPSSTTLGSPVTKESTLEQYTNGFVRTHWGEKFHVDRQCEAVQGRQVRECDPVGADSGMDPCRKCAPGLFQEWEREGFTN